MIHEPELWKDLETAIPGDVSVLPLAGALAQFDPHNSQWAGQVDKIAEGLVHIDSDSLDGWIEALPAHGGERPSCGHL